MFSPYHTESLHVATHSVPTTLERMSGRASIRCKRPILSPRSW